MQKEYLSEIEVEAVEAFNANTVMREAVRKILLEGVYYHGTLVKGKGAQMTKNFALELGGTGVMNTTNEQIGADLRARIEGIRYLEAGFQELFKIRKVVIKKDEAKPSNKAL